MKKLLVALLVALCMVAPALALDWDELPQEKQAYVDMDYPPGNLMDTYFDVYITDIDNGASVDAAPAEGDLFAGWCVDSELSSIKDTWYCAELEDTTEWYVEWGSINWLINNREGIDHGTVQAAIWILLDEEVPDEYADWVDDETWALVEEASQYTDFEVPDCIPVGEEPMVGAVMVTPCPPTPEDTGQVLIIEVPIPYCPVEAPEFPTLLIPVFLVGSVLVAASVLRRD